MQTTATDDGIAPASGILAAVAGRDEHVLLPAGVSRAVLDDVAARLAARRCRVLRPSTAGVLTLPGLLAQIVGRTPDAALEASDLERGFELLTVGPDCDRPDCDRIVLLLDRADALDEAALRYLQMAIRGAPLRLLFVGGSRLDELLAGEDFRALRRGFVRHAAPSSADPDPPFAKRRSGRWLLAGASVGASTGVVWLLHSGILAAYLAGAGLLPAMLPFIARL
jgi:hypothetical protein